jgi:hypothetical protein
MLTLVWALAILVVCGLFGFAVSGAPANAEWQLKLGAALGVGVPIFLVSGAVALVAWAFAKFRYDRRNMFMTVWTVAAALTIALAAVGQTYIASKLTDRSGQPRPIVPGTPSNQQAGEPITDPLVIARLNSALSMEQWFKALRLSVPSLQEQAPIVDAAVSLCGSRVSTDIANTARLRACLDGQMKGFAHLAQYYAARQPASSEPCIAGNSIGDPAVLDFEATARCLHLF